METATQLRAVWTSAPQGPSKPTVAQSTPLGTEVGGGPGAPFWCTALPGSATLEGRLLWVASLGAGEELGPAPNCVGPPSEARPEGG